MTHPTTVRHAACLVAVCALFVAALFPADAHAVNGFDKLKFGMSPDDVRAAYPDQVTHDPRPDSAPDGTIGGRFVLTGDPRLFEARVEVSCFFTKSGLSIIRLLYKKPTKEAREELLTFYGEHWGEPVRATERDRGRRTGSWSWPWEGLEMRSVEEDGEVKYQRVDFSERVLRAWTGADAMVCRVLPASSSCAFPDSLCAQQDTSTASGKLEHDFAIDDSKGEVSCSYEGMVLDGVRLSMKQPSEAAAEWVDIILERRLGEGSTKLEESASKVRSDTEWANHGVSLRVVRKAAVQTKDGWTGPVEYLRIKRTLASSTDVPAQR